MMKLFRIKLCILFLFSGLYLNAQISTQEEPFSFRLEDSELSKIPEIKLPGIEMEKQRKQEEKTNPKTPFRFGIAIDVSLNLYNSGKWDRLPNGDRLWQLSITSKGACSINLVYNYFDIPEGAKFHVYNKNRKHYLGAYTRQNVKPDKTFATDLIKGETIVLEYYEPAHAEGIPKIHISKVVHAYKNILDTDGKGFGDSDYCHINVNCGEGLEWQDQKRSVVLINTSTSICTGTLINNVREDGMPYVLTAYHCGSGNENEWIVRFNYESPGCQNQDGPTDQTIQNLSPIAQSYISDFKLVQLSESPPESYNVYYSGWNAVEEPSNESVTIHHPAGDIKKISFDREPVISSDYPPDPVLENSYWEVSNWESGSTESGSSGAPLFDQNQRLVGQLRGGYATCDDLLEDWYGKFSMSWDYGSSASVRLKDWLDPDDTGILALDGWDPLADSIDILVLQIIDPEYRYCSTESINISPKVSIKNSGLFELDSLLIRYMIDEKDTVSLFYEDTLLKNEVDTVFFPEITLQTGIHEFKAIIKQWNGEEDENVYNDTLLKTFQVTNNPIMLGFSLTTDMWGYETLWEIATDDGNTLYFENHLDDYTTYNETFCLDTGCYQLIVYDTYGDGIDTEDDYYLYFPENNYTLYTGTGNFTFQDKFEFCMHDKPETAFSIEDHNHCEHDTIQFINQSTGEIASTWYFEGGNPETSTEKNPSVMYENHGIYDVQLITEGAHETDTLLREAYIEINSSPKISFTITVPTDSLSADGSVSVEVSNGTPPFHYLWNNGNTNASLENIEFGNYMLTVTDANGCSATDTAKVNITASDIYVLDKQISVFPTPGDGVIHIQIPMNKVEAFDISTIYGITVYSENNPKELNRVDLSSQHSGLYIVRFTANWGVLTKKIVIR